ncbi:LysR family transcriptional regulator [Oceanicoccus sp. KOV_DT_Chl]|uniref:LysR family transcriptional regulator n=1 Tax=Oceanicoccus sp. KOV_DT_Chl TaxID=1904639 RepID=UPI00190E9156|nr:LysR family transcriptional regulator [Oceanicoccus sp. KOV_DT_Chl]
MSAQINDWSDIHFAYQVARHGTLSAAANALNVHHSTVLRRIDALEKRLNTRLFHRHARGYTTTDAGQLLLKTASQTQEDFDRLLGQLEGADEQLSGTLVITTVSALMPLVSPLIAEFQQHNPEIRIDLIVDSRIFKLEHGEAHISLRPGAQPKDPDYCSAPTNHSRRSLRLPRLYQALWPHEKSAGLSRSPFFGSSRSMPISLH